MSKFTPSSLPIKYLALGTKAIDLTGQTFGRLTALGPIERRNKRVHWLCACGCGSEAVVNGDYLRRLLTLSCGCLHAERTSAARKKHGQSNSRLYRVWRQIINRCTRPKVKAYKNYGGRGIAICNEWRHDYSAFHAYVSELEHYGENGYSLDRINNDGNYEPGNLRWATHLQQANNKRGR